MGGVAGRGSQRRYVCGILGCKHLSRRGDRAAGAVDDHGEKRFVVLFCRFTFLTDGGNKQIGSAATAAAATPAAATGGGTGSGGGGGGGPGVLYFSFFSIH